MYGETTQRQEIRLIHRETIWTLLFGCFLALLLQGCITVPISYYDAATYKNLTSLKAETMLLVEKFDSKPVLEMEAKIEDVTLKLRQAYEYEIGKGNPNSDTARQFKIIVNLFNEDVTDFQDSGPGGLGPKFFQEASVVLGQAFDIAIETENLKNKDKR
jgi:hypothetical protein